MEYVGNPGAVPSCNRDAVLEVFDCSTCEENPNNAKRTNADRIRAMTDEELAEWLDSVSKSWYDEGFTKDDETPLMSAYPATASQWIDWLKSPVEVEE